MRPTARPCRPPTPALLLRLLAVLLGTALLAGCATADEAEDAGASGPAGTGSASQPAWAEGMETITPDELPPEGRDTLELIEAGGPFPYEQDGTVFMNYERLLPEQDRGYYREYTVETPGLDHRGPRRIVTGGNEETYYTEDHYASFRAVLGDA